MFVKISKEDVIDICCKNGRDKPCGEVYINTNDISFVDGCFVTMSNHTICLNDNGIRRLRIALELE